MHEKQRTTFVFPHVLICKTLGLKGGFAFFLQELQGIFVISSTGKSKNKRSTASTVILLHDHPVRQISMLVDRNSQAVIQTVSCGQGTSPC